LRQTEREINKEQRKGGDRERKRQEEEEKEKKTLDINYLNTNKK
jgi:hypothetical protein